MAYFPWGEERTSTLDGTDKFATYFRDSSVAGVGQDYANARYYNNNFGRFWSPDPAGLLAARRKNPTTWNRYAYANDDPVNGNDRTGLDPTFSVTVWGNSCDWNTEGMSGCTGIINQPYQSSTSPSCPNPVTGCSAGTSTTGSPGTGSGGTGAAGRVTAELASAYQLAESLLKQPDCSNIFGQGTTASGATLTAAQVLTSLYSGGPLGNITVGAPPVTPPPGYTINATTQAGVTVSGIGGPSQNAAYITINDTAGDYFAGSALDQVVTLLHELGHAMNDIFGPGTSVIQPDGSSVPNGNQISQDNTKLVDISCVQLYLTTTTGLL